MRRTWSCPTPTTRSATCLSVSDNLGVAQVSTYDGRGLLTSRTWQGTAIDAIRAEFTYNALGQPTELRRLAGAAPAHRRSAARRSPTMPKAA